MKENKIGLNGFHLKIIAIVTMLIDHVGAILLPQNIELRYIGRISFPIFCFLIVEGAMHTKDIKKYQLRLLLFALISEIPYDLANHNEILEFSHQNVFFTLFLGLSVIAVVEKYKGSVQTAIIVIALSFLSILLKTDYSIGGVCFIICFYIFYKNIIKKSISFAVINYFIFGGVQNYALLSLVPICLYNGKRGLKIKYIFYAFYPVHLFILYLIKYKIT